MIRFFDKAVPAANAADGLATYEMQIFFEAYRDLTTRIVRPARAGDIAAYPAEHATYLAARGADHSGFPLAAWPALDEAERLGLAERSIHSVEALEAADLAAAPAAYRQAQEKAKAFLAAIRDDAPRLAARADRLEGDKAALAAENGELRAELQRLTAELARTAARGTRRTPAAGAE